MHKTLYILCKGEYANENANEFANAQMRSKCSIFNNNHNHCLPKLQYSRESLYINISLYKFNISLKYTATAYN